MTAAARAVKSDDGDCSPLDASRAAVRQMAAAEMAAAEAARATSGTGPGGASRAALAALAHAVDHQALARSLAQRNVGMQLPLEGLVRDRGRVRVGVRV